MIRASIAAFAFALTGTFPLSAQDWVIDAAASEVTAETRVFGQAVTASFAEFSAEITFDPEDLENAQISARVTSGTGTIPNREYQSALVSRDGLYPAEYSEAIFVSDEVVAIDEGYEARGTLTIKGESRDAVLPFTVEISDGRAVAQGTLEILRADFGVGGSSWAEVAPNVTVRLHIEADAG
ncbi:YceI family protein [Glycocaulis alkaliphilus]|uniref:YceI family protein n=1 Tax=Glycocaulis alkaliphilus TaxID=1434191 RepID=A0A3T0EBF8_9PROT|nr:YceI family protein [Glycocaulis alkaliphilus]AZU04506.1 YceI family protein [Glycocaulis alkaliphilus]GGB78914.1 polyisoprenoid-binding protein [Glycocaulis alkaliphilus]